MGKDSIELTTGNVFSRLPIYQTIGLFPCRFIWEKYPFSAMSPLWERAVEAAVSFHIQLFSVE
jgi:hypothetical protein